MLCFSATQPQYGAYRKANSIISKFNYADLSEKGFPGSESGTTHTKLEKLILRSRINHESTNGWKRKKTTKKGETSSI